jgi:integrase
VVKVYRQERAAGDLFTVGHYLDGRRQRKAFSTEVDAMKEAEMVARRIAKVDRKVMEVTDADWRIYSITAEALAPTGAAIDIACREYAEARKILGSTPLLEAVRFYTQNRPGELIARSVAEAVEELIEAKKNAGVAKRGIDDYKSRLRRFSAAFKCPIRSVSTEDIQQFLNGLGVAPRTKRNFKANIVTLFDFARSRQYLPRDRKTEAEHLDTIEARATEIGIFTPTAFTILLKAADAELLPYLAIRGFAGIRDSEINRMEWKHVNWSEGLIEVPASAAKKTRGKQSHARRRLVPIQPNLAQWLAPYRNSTGKICSFYNSERAARRLAAEKQIPWVHNGMRHAFGSYRVATLRNYPQVAYEMGNSVEIIKSSYDQVVTPKEAEAWFAIVPEAPSISPRFVASARQLDH